MSRPPTADELMQLCDARYRYAAGIDRRDWELHRSAFTDEIEVDFSSYDGRPPSRVRVEQWIDRLRPVFSGLAATQHLVSNPRATVDGDRAELSMAMQAEHVLDPDDPTSWFTIGGDYDDRLVRTADGWRISAVRLTVRWRRGRSDIMTIAAARGAARRGDP